MEGGGGVWIVILEFRVLKDRVSIIAHTCRDEKRLYCLFVKFGNPMLGME